MSGGLDREDTRQIVREIVRELMAPLDRDQRAIVAQLERIDAKLSEILAELPVNRLRLDRVEAVAKANADVIAGLAHGQVSMKVQVGMIGAFFGVAGSVIAGLLVRALGK